MNIFHAIYDWLVGFFGIQQLMKILSAGDYSTFRTVKGIMSIFRPLFPLLLLIEIITVLLYRKFKVLDYKISFFSFVLNALIGRFIAIAAIVFCIGLFEKYALFKTSLTWY